MKKKSAKSRITPGTKLAKVIRYAATKATGTDFLFDGDDYCLWGQIGNYCGVPDNVMNNQISFGAGSAPGDTKWDLGNKEGAVEQATLRRGHWTVARFRKYVQKHLRQKLNPIKAIKI